jgi:hypothetical protein
MHRKFSASAIARGLQCVVISGAALVSAQAQAPLDVRVALVIGNAAYDGSAALANSTNDAKAMGDTLRGLGFDVVELRDGSRAQMQQSIDKAREHLKGKQGIGMFYFAGHGVQLNWRNYMVPLDAKLSTQADVPAQAVDVAAVMEAFKMAGNRMNIVVLDACRDNPFPVEASGKGLAQVDAPPSTILAYATAPGNVAADGSQGNGLYTQFLLQELVKPQARIEDVFKRTRFAVRKASQGRQIPWESTSLEEDFMFNAGKVVAVPKPDNSAKERAYIAEKTEWNRVAANGRAEDLYAFLAVYPNGNYSDMAQVRLETLQKAQVRPQAGADGRVSVPFADRHQDGDRYEVVWRDGLTGLEQSRDVIEVRAKGSELFEMVSRQGPSQNALVMRSGFEVQNRFGTFDPPVPLIPGGEFKIGNRGAMRIQLTERDGKVLWLDWQGKVAARETITTPLGQLETYRVESSVLSQAGIYVSWSFWYEPNWGMPVRSRQETRRGGQPPDIRVRDVVARSRKS